jgi:hypothetical protein
MNFVVDTAVATVQRKPLLQRLFMLGSICAVIALGAELGCRIEDRLFNGIGLFEDNSEDALWTFDGPIRHGVPHAHFKDVSFNNFGLGGPDVADTPPEGCERTIFLGSSETFGGRQVYASLLQDRARVQGCDEMLNAAIPGMAIASMTPYYRDWLAKFKPDRVVIYPATHFYLSSQPPRPSTGAPPAGNRSAKQVLMALLESSRLFARLRDAVQVPAPLQRKRQKQWIDEANAGQPPEWLFTSLPEDRLQLFEQHLTELVQVIRDSGAEPVLLTHAVSVTSPPRASDSQLLYAMRVWTPRATEETLAAFPYAANARIRNVAAAQDVVLVDLAAALSTQSSQFVDMVHYAPGGHARVADMLQPVLLQ